LRLYKRMSTERISYFPGRLNRQDLSTVTKNTGGSCQIAARKLDLESLR
jgi:hypothetical protein